MAVGADAQDLEINATGGDDAFLIVRAGGGDIRGIAIRDVDVRRRDVDVTEEILRHEAVIGLGMLPRNADVFVQVERGDAAPVEVHRDELAVQQDGSAAGGEAQHGVGLFCKQPGNDPRRDSGRLLGSGLDDDLHQEMPRRADSFPRTSVSKALMNPQT